MSTHAMKPLGGLAVIAAIATMALGAACGPETTAVEERLPVAHTVTIEASAFGPSVLTARIGDTVTFVNKDFFPHTATAAERFDSGAIQPGASWTVTLTTAGTVGYLCLLHPTMTGTIRIEE